MNDFESMEGSITKRKDILHKEIQIYLDQLLHGQDSNSLHLNAIIVKLKSRIDDFEESPGLLDVKLDCYIKSLASKHLDCRRNGPSSVYTKAIASVFYIFSKVRGYKVVANCFHSDVYSLLDIARFYNDATNDENEYFMLSLWLSSIVLAPFPLEEIQAGITSDIIISAAAHLGSSFASKSQIGSLVLLSHVLTRPDSLQNGRLNLFYTEHIGPVWQSPIETQAKKLGYLMVLNRVLKLCTPEVGLHVSNMVFKDILLLDSIYFELTPQHNLNVLFFVKLLNRIANYFLKYGKYQEVSQIISVLVFQKMALPTIFDTKLRYSAAKTLASICDLLSQRAVNYQDQLINFFLNQLVSGSSLDIKAGFKQDLNIHKSATSIPKVHALLLFFGFIAMNRSLPASTIPIILSIVHQYLFLEIFQGLSELATPIRDASCFVVWAIVRFLDSNMANEVHLHNPTIMRTIFHDILRIIIFDRDLIIRRCGVSVLQELVGRHALLCLDTDNLEQLGKVSIKLVEFATFREVSEPSDTYSLIRHLLDLGVESNAIVPPIFDQIKGEYTEFEVVQRSVCTLLELGISSKPYKDATEFEKIVNSFSDSPSDHLAYAIISLASDVQVMHDFLLHNRELFHSYVSKYIKNVTIERADTYIQYLKFCKFNNMPIEFEQALQAFTSLTANISSNHTIKLLREYFTAVGPLNDYEFNMLLSSIKHGNKVISNSISSLRMSQTQKDKLIDILHEEKVSCTVKSLLLQSFMASFPINTDDDFNLLRIINCLDNYTRTEQGDVGSEVRSSTISLIRKCPEEFNSMSGEIDRRLIRISGEQIDRLRYSAFSLLSGNDELISSLVIYFDLLFNYYRDKVISLQEEKLAEAFWRGIVFSAAAFRGPTDVINASFRSLLKLFYTIGPTALASILHSILDLLVIPKDKPISHQPTRVVNMYAHLINLFVKLFEAGFSFPPNFDFARLYVRCYNLHINTKNSWRIKLVLRVFTFLAMPEYGASYESKKRLCFVACKHPNYIIRLSAVQNLYELGLHLNFPQVDLQLLDDPDWRNIQVLQMQYDVLTSLFTKPLTPTY